MEKRIYYHDTDAGGIVYYGQYLCYLEEARTEFLEKRGLSVEKFKERGFVYVVRQCNVSYRSPARYGDTLLCDAKLKKMGASQLIFDQTVHDKKDGRLIIEAEVSLVCLNKEFKPTAIPDDLKEKLALLKSFCDSILPMSISKEDVKYIAALARIDVPEDKLEGFTKTLGGHCPIRGAIAKARRGQCQTHQPCRACGECFAP